MKNTDNPGIYFQEISLLDMSYKTNSNFNFNKELEMPNIQMVYSCEILKPTDKKRNRTLVSIMDFHLFKGVRNWPFKLSLKFKAVFHADLDSAYPLENFAELQAPAYIVPYARELISNVTSRGVYPTLNIPPINVHAAMKKTQVKKSNE
ncbi:protein-export chaperone SecB [bacterium]|nr:protein-export chaperone SecB [bacterium]